MRRRPTTPHMADGPNRLTHSAPWTTATATTLPPDSAHRLTDALLSTASATTMSRRTAVSGLLPANSCVSHSVGSSRRPRRPTKSNFVPSRTETTPISHGLTHELSQCSFTQLPTTAQRASHTQSKILLPLYFANFRKLSRSRGSSDPRLAVMRGLSLELEHPQYFVDGKGSLQAKKGR